MKYLVAVFLLANACAASADYTHGGNIDTYDPVTGLYYKAVTDKGHRGMMSSKSGSGPVNVAIVNPATGSTMLLFKEPPRGYISAIVFETGFKDGGVQFHSGDTSRQFSSVDPFCVKNNVGVAKRKPRNKLLAVVYDKDTDQSGIYVAEKDGSNLKKVAVVPPDADWHIDVRNSRLRVVEQTGNGIKLDSFEW